MANRHSNRHCLLIGVNDYPNVEDATLQGCANDVALVGSLLIDRFRFPEDHFIVLRDRTATQAGIRGAFAEIVERVEPDDVVVCFYAGHGSRIADPHRPGGFVESIVPSDSGRGEAPNRDIYDVEIGRWVQRLNAETEYVTLLFDCCHSGSVTRDSFGEATREIPADFRPPERMFERGIVPEVLRVRRSRSASREAGLSGYVSGRRRAVTVAACRADELANEHLAREHGSTYRHGALSWFLGRILNEASPGFTWRDVFERLEPALTTRYRRQHPQLEGGKADELLFGTEQIRTASYLRVAVPEDGGVELRGGGAHGVTRGSLWSIRDAEARGLDDGDEVAEVWVESVRAATSLARPVAATAPGEIRARQRAFLRRLQLPEPGLRLAISVPGEKAAAGARLAELAAGSKLLRVAEEVEPAAGEPADLLVRCLAPRDAVAPGAPCPGLGPLGQWTWAAVDRDGRLAVRQRPEPADLPALVGDLVRQVRFRQLLELDNPDPTSRLRGRVHLWVRKAAGSSNRGEVVRLSEGERVDVEVENGHHQPVWVTVVELGCDGAIELLMPHPEHPTYLLHQGGIRLEPGEVASAREYYLRDPDRAPAVAGGLPLHLPDGFPWAAEPGETADAGFLHLKLLATLCDTDFEFLQQEAVRRDPMHPLEQLALAYHSGERRRRSVPKNATTSPEMDWTTVTVALQIGRKGHEIPRL